MCTYNHSLYKRFVKRLAHFRSYCDDMKDSTQDYNLNIVSNRKAQVTVLTCTSDCTKYTSDKHIYVLHVSHFYCTRVGRTSTYPCIHAHCAFEILHKKQAFKARVT